MQPLRVAAVQQLNDIKAPSSQMPQFALSPAQMAPKAPAPPSPPPSPAPPRTPQVKPLSVPQGEVVPKALAKLAKRESASMSRKALVDAKLKLNRGSENEAPQVQQLISHALEARVKWEMKHRELRKPAATPQRNVNDDLHRTSSLPARVLSARKMPKLQPLQDITPTAAPRMNSLPPRAASAKRAPQSQPSSAAPQRGLRQRRASDPQVVAANAAARSAQLSWLMTAELHAEQDMAV